MPDTDYIYVLGRDGKPQMPTKRKRYVKNCLMRVRQGLPAVFLIPYSCFIGTNRSCSHLWQALTRDEPTSA